MPRTKDEILKGLDPRNPASIQALIDFHRTAFGGYRMADDDTGGDGGKPDGQPDKGKPGNGDQGQDGKDDDDTLGDAGKKALKRERDARKALEQQVRDFKAAQDAQNQKLAEAFGIETKDAKSGDDMVTALQKQVHDMQRDNLVFRIATELKITDADDLALIKSAADEDAMRKLATRLAGKPSDSTGNDKPGTKRTPRSDPNQGRGDGADGGKPTSVAQVIADRRAARAAKSN